MKGEIFKPCNELETQFQQEKTMKMLFSFSIRTTNKPCILEDEQKNVCILLEKERNNEQKKRPLFLAQ